MPFQYLSDDRIAELIDALTNAQLATPDTRRTLLAGINPIYVTLLPNTGTTRTQLFSDAMQMNQVERLADGTVPLEKWLRAGVFLTDQTVAAKVFRAALDDVQHRSVAGPAPDVAISKTNRGADPAKLPETQEKIVHQNDLLPIGFLAGGLTAGRSVAKLTVVRYEGGGPKVSDGKPVKYVGTGWMIAPTLMITNHHVINARNPGEAQASTQELALQAASVVAAFDYDAVSAATNDVGVASLVAAHPTLDAAILRLNADPGRRALRLSREAFTIDKSAYVAVNIIQHPGGEPKQIGIRNNLVTAAEGDDVRYFTDTMPGSSGAPVMNDGWEVVALHRGSRNVEGVRFQGRDTAWVNVGTKIHSIIKWISETHPAIVAEVGT